MRWDWRVKEKHSPIYSHRSSLSCILDKTVNEEKFLLGCAKYWCITWKSAYSDKFVRRRSDGWRKSCDGMILFHQRKSLRKIALAICAPIHANVVVAGFENLEYITFSGFNGNVLPQFASATFPFLFMQSAHGFCKNIRGNFISCGNIIAHG